MKFTAIYNMNKTNFFDVKIPTIDEMIGDDDYCVIGDIEANDLEDAFYILNCEHPEHIVEKVKQIASGCSFPHTSLFIGDILVEENNNKFTYWFCESIGWKEMK